MGERKRIVILAVVMALIVLSAVTMTSAMLYHGAIERQKERLRESVQSEASLIAAIKENEEEHRQRTNLDADDTLLEHTLEILTRAHSKFKGFGETGEFVLGKRGGDQMVFLLRHRHYDLDKPLPIPIMGDYGEPMRRALSGQSGTDIILDYRGKRVIAAYEPVPELGLGLAAKIDLAEVRSQFINAAALFGASSLVLIAAGAFLFLRIGNPIVERLEESEKKWRALSEDLDKEVKRKVAELQQAERMAAVGRMVAVVAHEVRNPLQHIRLGVETLQMCVGQDNDKLEIMGEIQNGVTILDEIIGALLEYSRPVNLKYSSVQSGVLVRQALAILSHKLDAVAMHIDLEREEREIAVDPVRVSQVFVNVISNGIEAMNNTGDVRISSRFLERGGVEYLEFSISDDGPGMSEEILNRMDEPFFTTKIWGTGLGIPICRKIVDAHKGSMIIQSKPGEGTTVKITLPIRDDGQTVQVANVSHL